MSVNQSSSISKHEFKSLRQNFTLIQAQINNRKVDGQFLAHQVPRLLSLFDLMETEYEKLKHIGRFEALYNVSRILGASLELQVVLDQVMDAVIQLTGAERGFLMLRDQDGGLEVKAARNIDQQTLDSSKFEFSRTIVYQVLDNAEAVVTTNAAEDPRYMDKASIMTHALRSIMAVPLRARGQVIGVAYVDNHVVADLFDDADLNALEALGGQAAIAIENAKLFEQTDQQLAHTVAQLTQLRRIDRQLNETLDPDKAMQITLEWATRLTNSVQGHLGLLEDKSLTLPAIQHYGTADDTNLPTFLDESYPCVKQVIETADIVADTITRQEIKQSILIVPVIREQRVTGVVVLHKADTQAYTEEEIDIAVRIVSRAAVTIDNARLYEKVQAADRAKTEFVGLVAHDLKVPMTSIMGYASLTKMIGEEHNNFVDRQAEFLDKIENTVQRMEVLVTDLADISRIESGHFYMEPICVSVRQIVESVKDNASLQMQSRGHRFITDIEPGLPDMYVDYYRLLQVLTNLVSNAYKYTPDGGTITLRVRLDSDRIQFTVKDTGIGLSAERIARLGTKFWRAEDDFTRSQPGTGLGYAITQNLVELMGSKIQVDSHVGKGSSFSFSIAVAQSVIEMSEDTQPIG